MRGFPRGTDFVHTATTVPRTHRRAGLQSCGQVEPARQTVVSCPTLRFRDLSVLMVAFMSTGEHVKVSTVCLAFHFPTGSGMPHPPKFPCSMDPGDGPMVLECYLPKLRRIRNIELTILRSIHILRATKKTAPSVTAPGAAVRPVWAVQQPQCSLSPTGVKIGRFFL